MNVRVKTRLYSQTELLKKVLFGIGAETQIWFRYDSQYQ